MFTLTTLRRQRRRSPHSFTERSSERIGVCVVGVVDVAAPRLFWTSPLTKNSEKRLRCMIRSER